MQKSKPRILICGGRDYADYHRLSDVLNSLCYNRKWIMKNEIDGNWLPNVIVISGKAKGADTLAIDWAVVNWCDFIEFPAQWKAYGKQAGPIRNQQMLDEGKPDIVIAFPGGNGTRDMVRRTRKAGVEVIEID